ncbi:MAG: ABC transporter ATP-binding protein [Clostridia bacterium]|nr:ABC transporter ATP-binding protein [Clostridia bacterium]
MKRIREKIGGIREVQRELRWVSRYTYRYRWAVAWYVLLGAVSTLAGLATGLISKRLIDVVTGFDTGEIVWIAVAYVTAQLFHIGLNAVTSRISARVQIRVNQEIRADIFRKILDARWEGLSCYHSGDLLARSGRDSDAVASSVLGWWPSLIIHLLQFVGAFLLILRYDPTLALMALAGAPITLLGSVFLLRRVRRHNKEMRQIGAEMTAFHSETFQHLQTIKSFGVTDTYFGKLDAVQRKQKNATLKHNLFTVLTSSFSALLGLVVGGVCFFWSVYRLWQKEITYGDMILFLQLAGMLSAAFGSLVALVPAAINAATAAGRIMEVTDLPAEDRTPLPQTAALLTDRALSLHVEGVRFAYPDGTAVFDAADLQAQAGQIVALVGPSGGGKTTLLRILLGLMAPQEGTAYVSGADGVTATCSPATRSLFAYVPQGNTLFSGTIAENLRVLCPDATDAAMEEALRLACADFVWALPEGIYATVGERGAGLSEGQVQRLAIARALLSDAPILLLDEATSALDADTEQQLLHNIATHHKHRICLVTTHRPSVLAVCHRVYRISDKTLIEQ